MISGKLRVNLLRSFIVIYLGISFLVGYFMYDNLVNSQYEANTIVGSTYIGGMEKKDASKTILLSYVNWRSNAKYYLSIDNKQIPLDLDDVTYNHDSTISLIRNGSNTSIDASFSQDYISEVIVHNWGKNLLDNINLSALTQDIDNAASSMLFYKVFSLNDYITSADAYEVLYSEIFQFSGANELIDRLQTDGMTNIAIPGETRWSMLDTFQTFQFNYSPSELSTIASMIDKLTINYNFTGYLKFNHTRIPDTQFLGYDCDISYSQDKDLSFYSPSSYSLNIVFEKTGDNQITAYLRGLNIGNTFTIVNVDQTVLLHELNQDTQSDNGVNGLLVKVTRLEYDIDYNLVDEVFLYQDFYPPYDLPQQ